MQDIARYYPIVTTIFSFIIAREMYLHYRQSRFPFLLCWILGVCAFGLAGLAASINILAGWSPATLKLWYLAGALIGGFPLAQGTVYLLMSRRFADISTVVMLVFIAIAAMAIVQTPVNAPADFDTSLTGKLFAWEWVRFFPLITNSYSFLVLVTGGAYSAYKHRSSIDDDTPYLANATIALGALMPGIGGTLMRMGFVYALFVVDFLGLIVIYYGFRILKKSN